MIGDVVIARDDPRWPEVERWRAARDRAQADLAEANGRLAALERPERLARVQEQRAAALAAGAP